MSETVNQVETNATSTEEKTFTQSELNNILGDRIKREREKYPDYEELKEKAARLDQIEEASKSEIQKMTEKASKLEAELLQMKKAEDIRTMRAKVSEATGIPANLLTAETEEECQAQADAIKAFAKPSGYPAVRDAGEIANTSKGSTAQQFAEWFNNRV